MNERENGMQGVRRRRVRLLPHDGRWAAAFEAARGEIETLWEENVADVQHIGSTAIRGICAKPILDIAVALYALDALDVAALEAAGYAYCGPQNPEKTHHLFALRDGNDTTFQLMHCYALGDAGLAACLAFRDHLNAHPEDAAAYAALKTSLAERYPDNRAAYTEAKEHFIQEIHAKIRREGFRQ